MRIITPKRLTVGSRIRVIAPSRSMSILSKDVVDGALKALNDAGFSISFSDHASDCNDQSSSSVDSRLYDLHEAFSDDSVDAIMTAIGGYNSNQLLHKIDYELIRTNPKILCGFSDITVLSNAILAKTGLMTYSGPHFSSWAMSRGREYMDKAFMDCLTSSEPYSLEPSHTWSDDAWFINQNERKFVLNKDGFVTVNPGHCSGRIIGGHIRCLSALQGTAYWPGLKDAILFIEEDEETDINLFDRLLQSLIHQNDFGGVRGIVIGRFQRKSKVPIEQLVRIIKDKHELDQIPVIINANFGHTTPITTFPVGGQARISAMSVGAKADIFVLKH